MMAKPIRALELHYPMIQFLIIMLTLQVLKRFHGFIFIHESKKILGKIVGLVYLMQDEMTTTTTRYSHIYYS